MANDLFANQSKVYQSEDIAPKYLATLYQTTEGDMLVIII